MAIPAISKGGTIHDDLFPGISITFLPILLMNTFRRRLKWIRSKMFSSSGATTIYCSTTTQPDSSSILFLINPIPKCFICTGIGPLVLSNLDSLITFFMTIWFTVHVQPPKAALANIPPRQTQPMTDAPALATVLCYQISINQIPTIKTFEEEHEGMFIAFTFSRYTRKCCSGHYWSDIPTMTTAHY